MRYDLLHPKALHKALVEHLGTAEGVPQERQVRRWVTGDTPVPRWAKRAIDEIMQAPAHEETPPPWAEAFEAKVVDELEQMRGVLASHDQVLIDAVDRAVRRNLGAGAESTRSGDDVG